MERQDPPETGAGLARGTSLPRRLWHTLALALVCAFSFNSIKHATRYIEGLQERKSHSVIIAAKNLAAPTAPINPLQHQQENQAGKEEQTTAAMRVGEEVEQCTPEQLSIIKGQLPPDDCLKYRGSPWTQNCSISYATRCMLSVFSLHVVYFIV